MKIYTGLASLLDALCVAIANAGVTRFERLYSVIRTTIVKSLDPAQRTLVLCERAVGVPSPGVRNFTLKAENPLQIVHTDTRAMSVLRAQ